MTGGSVEAWWGGLLGVSLELALVALGVWLVLLATHRWSPSVRWAIAAVVLLKMALPTVALPTSLLRVGAPSEIPAPSIGALPALLGPLATETSSPAIATVLRAEVDAPSPVAEVAAWTTAEVAFAVYLLGVVAVLALGIVDLARFRRRSASGIALERDFAATWRGLGGRGRSPRVLCTPAVTRPICFGIFRPTVLLPDRRIAARAEELVVAHEFGHLLHRDPLRNVAHWLLTAFWWFHPAAWWVGGRLRRLQEERCDDAVVAWSADPAAYGEILVHAARRENEHEGRGPSLALGMVRAREHSLAPRLRRIFDPSLSKRTRFMQRLLPCLLILAAAAAPSESRSQRGVIGANAEADAPAAAERHQDPAPEQHLERALAWLAKHQRDDGSFAENDHVADALAVLAFLASGQTARSGPHAKVVAKAVQHLDNVLASEGDDPQGLAAAAAAVAEHAVLSGEGGLTAKQLEQLGKRARSEAVGPREAYWLGYTLLTVRYRDHELDEEGLAAVRARLPLGHAERDRGWSAEATCAASIMLHVLAGGDAEAEGFDQAVERVLGAAARDLSDDPALLQMGSMAMFQVGGSAWRAWIAAAGPEMGVGEDGSVGQGRAQVSSTALMALALSVKFRFMRLIR